LRCSPGEINDLREAKSEAEKKIETLEKKLQALSNLHKDIDSAGLSRVEDKDDADSHRNEGPHEQGSNTTDEITRVEGCKTCKHITATRKETNKGISLSGLLNAIDGVASHEGRVLVMITNHPERLDDALIRPGRVDMKIGFTLATREQIKELFVRMYSPDTEEHSRPFPPATSTMGIAEKANLQSWPSTALAAENPSKVSSHAERIPNHRHLTTHPNIDISALLTTQKILKASKDPDSKDAVRPEKPGLDTQASAFAAALPESTFSPAT